MFTGHTTSFWNDRYAEPGCGYGTAPNAYLAAQAHRLRPGMTALVPGDGEGRNGVWLAEQGVHVLSVDLSEVGLQKAQALAAERGVAIQTERADLTAWDWPEATFDVVVEVYLHLGPGARSRLHAAMLAALKPGGLLILEAFRKEQLRYREQYGSGGPPDTAFLYDAETLQQDFAAAEILDLEETVTTLREGSYHSGPAAVVRGLFRRATPA
jgi:cyclopropane fatty-acyl-phospholipid synthase-like methyltransferase